MVSASVPSPRIQVGIDVGRPYHREVTKPVASVAVESWAKGYCAGDALKAGRDAASESTFSNLPPGRLKPQWWPV